MSRTHRYLPPGLPAHVIVRGHNKMVTFVDPADFELFLLFLQHGAANAGVLLHAFAIMSTHAHFIVTPSTEASVAKMVQLTTARYARYFNVRHQRSGAVWEGRYRGFLIDTDRYFFTVLRYVERNPVAAGIVEHPHEYVWSSYAAHALGAWPPWLSPHPLYLALAGSAVERQHCYRTICDEDPTDEEIAWLRYVIDRDWPYGTVAFQRSAKPIILKI